MNQALLTIAIPTYNRPQHLGELLESLLANFRTLSPLERSSVTLVVRDNASTYDCRGLVEQILEGIPHQYWRNSENIGGDRNFLECIKNCETEYLWMIGDDELIPPTTLASLLGVLVKVNPSLCILSDGQFRYSNSGTTVFESYRDFMIDVAKTNPYGVIAHSLISCNVFRPQEFNMAFALTKVRTNYSHMYGMTPSLVGRVYLFPTEQLLIQVRSQRAPFADRVTNLEAKQNVYLAYLGRKHNVPGVVRYAAMKLLILPFKLAAEYLVATYRRAFHAGKQVAKRLLGMGPS